jgi:hypothetical protein
LNAGSGEPYRQYKWSGCTALTVRQWRSYSRRGQAPPAAALPLNKELYLMWAQEVLGMRRVDCLRPAALQLAGSSSSSSNWQQTC